MKNILKRGTSLLLVVAMLLSFAVVVGATDTELTKDAHVKIWADTVALKAGETAYVPIYINIDDKYGIGVLDFTVYADSGITLNQVVTYNIGTMQFGTMNQQGANVVFSGSGDYNGGKLVSWSSDQTLVTKDSNGQLKFACLAEVTANRDVSAKGYGIHIGVGKTPDCLFQVTTVKTTDPDTGEEKIVDITKNNETHGTENATFEDGAAIVYNDLPMFALTKTTFEAPTMAEQIASGYKKGDYELNQYLKIVYQDGAGNVQMDDVSSATMAKKDEAPWTSSKVTFSKVNNKLSINPAAADQSTGTLTVTEATAKTSNVTYQVNSDVTFKVRKAASVLTSLAFTDNRIEDNANISAPAQNTQNYVDLGLGLQGEDQYGVDMALTSSNVTVEFYSDSACTNKIDTTLTGITHESNKIRIVCTLENDVWCKLTATGAAGEKTLTETVTFRIESTKPHATRAEVVFSGNDINTTTNTVEVPVGEATKTVNISATVYDQKNGVMDGVTYTVKAYWGTKDTPGTDIPETGVEASATLSDANVLEITSKALENLGSATEVKLTVEIAVDGISDKITQEIKLVKAQPVATSLASNNSGWNKGQIVLNPMNVAVPGIGLTNDSATNAAVVQVLDQYDQPMKNADGSYIMVPVENFAFYPARVATAEDTDTTDDTAGGKYVKTGKAIPSEYAWFTFNSSNSGMLLHLKNDKVGNDLILDTGAYIVEATYTTAKGDVLKAGGVLKLTRGESVPTTATVTASTETIYVPYQYITDQLEEGQSKEVTLTAKVEDQYGEEITSGVSIELNGNNVRLGDSELNTIKTEPEVEVKAVEGKANQLKVTLNSSAAGKMLVIANGASQPVNEADLTIPVTVKVNGTAVGTAQTATVKVKRDDFALRRALIKMSTTSTFDEETIVERWLTNPSTGERDTRTVNLISPKVETNYYFAVKYFDQYGGEMTSTFGTAFYPETTGLSWQGGTTNMLTAKAGAEGTFSLTIPGGNTRFQFNVKFAPMQFVNGKGDPYTIDKLLHTAKLSKVYNRDTWYQVIGGASAVTGPNDENSKVYIRGAEGQNNVDVTQKIWAEVIDKTTGQTVYDARDSLANPAGPTASATEKAGTYIVKIFYREKEGDAPIEVCSSGEFTISPKPITIGLKANETIEKEYDGTKNLPDDAANKLELNGVLDADQNTVSLNVKALEFVSKDVLMGNVNNNITVVAQDIVAVTGTSLLSGADAGNYTASSAGLKGKITKRTIVVTPNSSEQVKLTYGDDVAKKLASEYTTNINELPTTCVAPTIGGSMELTDTTNDAVVTVYNAGTYNVALGNLSLTGTSAGNYQLELASGTHTWTIGKKTIKFLLTCEREADYGVYGRELYRELETMIASTDAGSKNIKELFDTSKLEFRGSAGTTTVAKTGDVVVDAGTYAVTAESLTLAMSNNYDVQDAQVQITVKKHTIVSDDIKQNGGTQSVTFSGERQTLTNYKVSFTYKDREITLAKNQDFAVLENSNTILDTSTRLKVKAAENSANYEGEATASWSWYILARSVSTDDIEVSQVNVPTYDGNEHQVEIAVNHIGPNKDEAWLKFFTVNNIYFRTGDKATDAGEHTLAFSLTGPYASGRDVDPSKRLCELRWTIEKSNEKPIGDQTANTKYGQPGSIEIAVPTGAAKGLTTSNLSVSALTDNDQIVDGTPSATFENGKIVVNWKLKGDATTIGKSATLQVTVAESDNYKEYSFGITVTAAKKDAQDKFFIATEDGRSAYSYSEAGVLMQASGNQGDVTWIMDSEYQAYAEIVDGNYVKFKKPGTVTIKATAKETNDYAAAERTYTLTITKGQVTVSASSATMTANDPLPGFSATASGLNPKDSVSKVFQTLTATVSTDGKTAGTFRVTPNAVFKTGVKDWNEYYELSFVQGTLTVNPAVSVIDTVLPTIIAGNGCANGYANCACESFYDLDASRWYHEAIDWAYNLGLMNGTTKSTFGPNAAATRAQTWTMLARIAGQDTRRSSTWYEVGQKWAMNLGITDGTNPMGSLTREQLAAMLYRYVGSPAVNGTLTFTDSANVSTWARNAMIWAVQNGILDGVGGNRLNPKGTTTRAQAAAIFMRFSKLINK